jgi:hypothetical protein
MDMHDARDELAKALTNQDGLDHLQVKKYGSSLILHSGTGRDDQKHARLTHLSGAQWGLSFPLHTGRWDKTPFTGTLAELLDLLVTDFPFFLEHHG